uniref:Coatomer subunit delta n=1 Tax=Oryza meridionalis TaxID=40149 RepID=A0A0E0ECL0_9ORYZ
MSRIRIEGLLAAFPKLVGTGKQHTYVKTENVPEYSPSLDEEGVCKTAFELIFAFDEAISLGNKENVTVQQVKQYCEMESHEEKAHKLMMQSKINETRDVMKKKASELDKMRMERGELDKGGYSSISGPRVIEKTFNDMSITGSGFGSGSGLGGLGMDMDSFASKPKRGEVILEDVQPSSVQSRASPLPPSDPVTVTIEEKLNVTVKRDGGVNNFDVQGTLALQVLNDADGFIQLQIENQDVPGLSFKTHPNINKDLFNSQQVVGAKDPNRPFPSGQNETPLVKWRIQGMDESSLPLSVNCWPSVSGSETYVNIEYEAAEMFDLHNVVISIPLPALREAPSVRQIDGEWKYDSRNSVLEWSILLIDQSNRSGSMEFVVPPADPSTFFPISIGFSTSSTFSDLKVTGIRPLKDGNPPKYSQRARLVAANYQVVLAASIISKSGKVPQVPEYSPSLDEEGVCKTAFELIFAFDEAICLGNKENVTVQQVKQYCEMESHEEKAHKLMMQSKINETRDVMKKKASELDKMKMERGKLDKGGYSAISGPRVVEKAFGDMSITGSGFGSGSGLGGLSMDMDSFASKPKGGRPSAAATAPGKGLGMKLGKTQKTNQFLESLKAEGEVILEDVQPSSVQSRVSPLPPSLGMKLGKTQKTNQFLESLKAEGEVILEDVQPSSVQSRVSPLPPSDPVTVTIEEKLNVTVKRDGGVNNFDVQGTLALQVLNDTDGFIQLQIENQDVPGLSFKTHPNINKDLFNSQQVVGAKDPNRPFPSGQNETPLAAEMFDLHNVAISIPLPALREAPSVRQIDGEWRYDSRNSVLEWSILLIDQSNRSGSMEFVVPPADPSTFFPISIGFSASSTFSDLKVTGIRPLKDGNPPKYSQRARLVTANYQVV